MIQAIVKDGKVKGEQIPAPMVSKGSILIKVRYSCISIGTETSKIKRSGKSLLKAAIENPEEVKQVVDMIKARGISKTLSKVAGVVGSGKQTGYSLSGVVIAVGDGVSKFSIGDLAAAAGADLANHAEFVSVPEKLVIKIPNGLEMRLASTVTLGGIAMQGVRRANLKFGEFAVVMGVGVLGLLAVQMLRLSGVRVAAVDLDEKRLELAKEYGAEYLFNPNSEDIVSQIENWTNGYGADAVIFTAATQDSKPLSQAFKSCKRKGKVVLVGVSGMNINRADIYEKELDFLISTSYGPGRYDKEYEEKGNDYPYAYVRWTENRNMQEYLRLLITGSINIDKMIDSVFTFDKIEEAFDYIKSDSKPLFVLLDYGEIKEDEWDNYIHNETKVILNSTKIKRDKINVALIGAGNFAGGTHLPNLAKMKDKYNIYAVMSRTGFKAKNLAKQFGADIATTDMNEILNDKDVDLVLVSTRHDNHAQIVLKALKKGKHVFVEKPLAVNIEELNQIKEFYDNDSENKPVLMVGYNRRFSAYAKEITKHIKNRVNPLFIHYRMNAGFIKQDSWVHENGGRIVGEGCHIVDLMTSFTNSKIVSFSYEKLSPKTDKFSKSDNVSLVLKYEDGSIATIEYFAVGNKKFSKEYMEIHFDEKTIVMDDYKSLKGYGLKMREIKTSVSEKGHFEEFETLYKALKSDKGEWPIELWDMLQTTNLTLSI
jgi:predicted dehydrogenase/threonine dehydrogenase-like Zn-dependent dehydrogenase